MKIIISDIPGDFPTGYSEQIYLETRSVKIGRDYTIIETANSHKALNDQNFSKRKIQSIFYDRYTVQLVTTESVDIDRINMANTISIIQDSGEIHTARIIDFADATRMNETEFRLYNLIYINLSNKQTIDYLSNYTVNANGNERAYFQYTNYDTSTVVKIKTFLNINFDFTAYEITENTDNYIKSRSSESGFSVAEFIGYVSESEKNDLLKYINYTNLGTLKIFENANPLTEYAALEVPEIIIDDSELEGLFPVVIRLRYSQELKYPFVS